MLESYVDSAPQALGDNLSFKLPSTGDAIAPGGRREAIIFPQGGNQVSATGVRDVSFRIVGDGSTMLDPFQGLFLRFKCTDTSGATNTMNLPAHGVWNKCVLRCAGVEAGSTDSYNRNYTMLLASSDPEVKANLDVSAGHIGEQLAANASKVFGHKIVTGLTECGKLIPLKYCPWELTLTCDPDLVGEAWAGAVTISDMQLSVTLLEPTSDVTETLHSHLSNGKGLPLHCQSWYCVQQATQANQTLHIAAAKSRLDKVFFTMCGKSDLDCRDFVNPGETFEFGLQLGPKRVSERDLKDRAGFWDMLSRTVGRKNIMDITRVEFGGQTGSAEKKIHCGESHRAHARPGLYGIQPARGVPPPVHV